MNKKPYIVTHSEDVCTEEGNRCADDDAYADAWQGECAYRYLVWGESHLDAARKVQAHKKSINRILPSEYNVFALRSNVNRDVQTLTDGFGTSDDQADLETFEDMFGDMKKVQL